MHVHVVVDDYDDDDDDDDYISSTNAFSTNTFFEIELKDLPKKIQGFPEGQVKKLATSPNAMQVLTQIGDISQMALM